MFALNSDDIHVSASESLLEVHRTELVLQVAWLPHTRGPTLFLLRWYEYLYQFDPTGLPAILSQHWRYPWNCFINQCSSNDLHRPSHHVFQNAQT